MNDCCYQRCKYVTLHGFHNHIRSDRSHLQQNLVLRVETKQLKTVSLKKIFLKFFFKFAHLQMWSLDPRHRGHERVQNLGTVSPDVVFVKLVGPSPITLIQSPVE